jgi:hypothetical protein
MVSLLNQPALFMNGWRLRKRSLDRQGVFGTAREPIHGGLREKHPVFHAPENTLSIKSPLTRCAVHE